MSSTGRTSPDVRVQLHAALLDAGRLDEARQAADEIRRSSPPVADMAMMAENFEMAMAVMRGLVRRLREADRKIGSLALLDVYGRVARLLLDMAENVDGEKVVTKRLPKQDIAKMIGASREMVSRVMKDLQMGGYIEVRGSNIVLRDTIMLPE